MSMPPIVMVVDDDEDEELACLFGEFLKDSGFNAMFFADPLLALELFSRNAQEYWLVIADLKMLNLNGIDLAKRMRNNSPSVKKFSLLRDFLMMNISKSMILEKHEYQRFCISQ